MPPVADFLQILGETVRDVLPIATVLTVFQFFVLRRALPNPRRLLLGFGFVYGMLVSGVLNGAGDATTPMVAPTGTAPGPRP